MSPELMQLLNYLRQYRDTFAKIKDRYKDAEYIAWMSVYLDKSQWPIKEGSEFAKARKDSDFKRFRMAFKRVAEAQGNFQGLALPPKIRMEYQQKFVREEKGVPF